MVEKNTKIKNNEAAQNKRLQEISEIAFGTLTGDEVLRLLAERTNLLEAVRIAEEERKKEEERLEAEKKAAEKLQLFTKKKKDLQEALAQLNQSISSDKENDELLTVITKRKELEKQLKGLDNDVSAVDEVVEAIPTEPIIVSEVIVPEKKIEAPVPVEEIKTEPLQDSKISVEEDFGKERIRKDDIVESSEVLGYMDQLKSNSGSLGTFLQNMPLEAKKNKAFMLKVAAVDPAYAMHFADKNTLKIDEDFNVRVAAQKNLRNSGNALAEMLPEARTSKVVMAAVKNDYLNVKFIRPAMEDYDEILSIAKKGTLEKIKELKEAADVLLLVPQLLQQDTEFMEKVQGIIGEKKSE